MNAFYPADQVNIVYSGQDYFDRLEHLIDEAKESIHLQTYIFDEDETGKRVAEKLMLAARKGVTVFVLADAFGSYSLSRRFVDRLKESGVHFRFFSPLFSSESIYLGRRLHHKIIVTDKYNALVGGINIADKYHGLKDEPAWLDYAVYIKGDVCNYLHVLCSSFYDRKKFKEPKLNASRSSDTDPLVRFSRNDWIRRKSEIVQSYTSLFNGAENELILVASYFVAGHTLKALLRKARKKGVEIKLILAGKTDLPLFKLAEKHLYRFLILNGIQIYEWPKSVMHGKAIIADEKNITIGSYNLNYLSHYRSIELNVDIKEWSSSSEFAQHLEEITKNNCIKIDPENHLKNESRFKRFINAFAYYYLLFIMQLFLPRRK